MVSHLFFMHTKQQQMSKGYFSKVYKLSKWNNVLSKRQIIEENCVYTRKHIGFYNHFVPF